MAPRHRYSICSRRRTISGLGRTPTIRSTSRPSRKIWRRNGAGRGERHEQAPRRERHEEWIPACPRRTAGRSRNSVERRRYGKAARSRLSPRGGTEGATSAIRCSAHQNSPARPRSRLLSRMLGGCRRLSKMRWAKHRGLLPAGSRFARIGGYASFGHSRSTAESQRIQSSTGSRQCRELIII